MVVGQIVGSSTVERVIGYFFCVLGLAGSVPLLDLDFWGFAEKGAEMSYNIFYQTLSSFVLRR